MRYRVGLRIVVACFALVLIMVGRARAAPSAERVVRAAVATFGLDWWTVDAGGGSSAGSSYSLSGTLGQFDVGPGSEDTTGNGFRLIGGFWAPVVAVDTSYRVYLPLIIR